MDYWKDCISEAFEDAGIVATPDQLDTVTSWAEGAHDNYGLATGDDVASANHSAQKDDEIRGLKTELRNELNKETCETCGGTGNLTTYGGTFQSTSSCYKCHGQGRH